jgi:hypothetical protein
MGKFSRRFAARDVLWWGSLAGMVLNAGCSDGGIDRDDELGVGDRTRVEVVVVGESDSSGAAIARPDSMTPSPAEAASVAYDPEGEFTVQIGVFSDATRAAEKVRVLDDLGYPAYAIARTEGDGVRVRIGYFRTRGDALRFGKIYSEDTGSEFWVDRRTNEMY